MDGTLLNHDDYRWQAAAPCIAKLGELSVPIILNTSKTYAEVRAWVIALNISQPFIVENGSAIFCPVDYFAVDMYQSLGLTTTQDDGYVAIELGSRRWAFQVYLTVDDAETVFFANDVIRDDIAGDYLAALIKGDNTNGLTGDC